MEAVTKGFFALCAIAVLVSGANAVQTRLASPGPDVRGRIAFLGDSVTRGKWLEISQAFPALIQKRLDTESLPFDTINEGVNGDTSAGGLARLDSVLARQPDIVVVALGVNDVKLGLKLVQLERNLVEIVTRCQRANATVLLIGLRLPPWIGAGLSRRFAALYGDVAVRCKVAFVPFLMEGAVGNQTPYRLADGHPNAEGQKLMASNIWRVLGPIVRERVPTRLAKL